MPTYEYECRACSQRVEVFQKITDNSLTECTACGGNLRKLLFPAGIIFKGSGFYVTDYKNKEAGKSGGRNGSATSSESSGSTEKSEKSEQSEKSEKSEKSESPAKKETATASTSTPSTGD